MKLKFQLMKNFNIILIACLAFLFLSSSGCSKEEEEKESPYKREQIIGRWYTKSYWIIDKSGYGYWKDEPNFGNVYQQFNADGTYYTNKMKSDLSSWTLKGKKLTTRLSQGDGSVSNETVDIEELTEIILITNRHLPLPNIAGAKMINEKFMNKSN